MSARLQGMRGGARAGLAACVIATLALPGLAHAGCSFDDASPSKAAGWRPAVYHPGSDGGLFLPASDRTSIVGLWKFEWLSKNTPTHTNPMPDNTLIDFGLATWHADGTELMNSGIRNPADGDFCQGVWTAVSPDTYQLNHFALAYAGGNYVGPAHMRLRVTVDGSGSRYSGVFVLTQYLATVTPGHEFDENTALVTITGTVTGRRVTAN